MRRVSLLLLAAFSMQLLASSGDWLSSGGDAQNSRWQRREVLLKSSNVQQMQLMWRRQLGGARLSSPVIMGHMATHRGTLELLFTLSSAGELFAIDGDFGTVFWKRMLGPTQSFPCVTVPAPAITPLPPANPKEEEDEDAPQPLRPVYAVAPDLRLHAIHPGTGQDLSPSRPVATKAPRIRDLTLQGTRIVAQSGACEGEATEPVSIDVSGQAAPENPASSATVFEWQKRLLMLTAKLTLAEAAPVLSSPPAATREDEQQTRWVYVSEANAVTAYRVSGAGQPQLTRAWSTPMVLNPAPPALAADLLFVLSRGDSRHHARLYAFHASTGRLLFQSSPTQIEAAAPQSALAIANGHVCFTAADGAVYSFGLPMEKE